MTQVVVTPEQLQQTSGLLQRNAQQINDTLNAAHAQVQSLIDGWRGAGSLGFQEAWSQWQAAQLNIHNVLEQIASIMAANAQTYESSDSQVGAGWRNVGG
jgi:WXG100 family type VII secretion target